MERKGAVQATIVLEGAEIHRVEVTGNKSALPSESLAALKASIGAFLTEYMKQNAIAVEGEEVDMLEEVISSEDDDDEEGGGGEGGERTGKNKNGNKKQKQPQQEQARPAPGNKKRARVERAEAKAKAAAVAAAAGTVSSPR